MEILKKRVRKSGFEDVIFVLAVIFTIAIFILIVSKAWGSVEPVLDEGINSALPSDSSVNVSRTLTQTTETIQMFDKLLPFILIGLFAFIMIGAALYLNHPVMLIVGIIVLSVAILLGVIYSNVYNEISSSDSFATENDNLPIIEIFMKFLPFIIILMIIGITALILYSKSGGTKSL